MSELDSARAVAATDAQWDAWREYWRKVFHFDHSHMEPWIALRNTIGVTLPLAVGAAIGMPLGGLAVATGALQVSYSDGHSPYLTRAKRMLTATFLCALAVVAGGLAGRNLVLSIAVPSLWAFAAGLAVSLGPTAENLGVISVVTLIIFAAQPLTPERALASGLLALGGGLLQTALALVLWPVRRYQPEQRALADFYSELSRAAVVPAKSEAGPPASEQSTAARETLAGLGNDTSLEAAQVAKFEMIADKLQLGPEDHVIEIGTGWGGFAIHAAARHGCRVTTTTILPYLRLRICMRPRISSAQCRSRSPVGSSQIRIVGSAIRARAIASRCCLVSIAMISFVAGI